MLRFRQIMRFLHVSDPLTEVPLGEDSYDKLGKVRVLLEMLKKTFKSEYCSPKDLAVDEAIIPFKGRLSF